MFQYARVEFESNAILPQPIPEASLLGWSLAFLIFKF